MFSKDVMKPKEVFEILKYELPRVFNKELSYSIRSSAQLELIGAIDYGVVEMDGKTYVSQFLLILAHENTNFDSFGTYFVVKATPYNCYYGEAKNNSLYTTTGLESIPNKKDDILTRFYRNQMGEFWGKNRYKIECASYFTRAKIYQEEKAKREYKKILDNAINQIEEDEKIL